MSLTPAIAPPPPLLPLCVLNKPASHNYHFQLSDQRYLKCEFGIYFRELL